VRRRALRLRLHVPDHPSALRAGRAPHRRDDAPRSPVGEPARHPARRPAASDHGRRLRQERGLNIGAGEKCVPVSQPLGGKLNVCRGPNARDAGVVLGDLLVLGAHYTPFVRGLGYDTETDIRRLFDTNQDTLSQPLVVDTIFATGDRLSLAYAAPGSQIY